MELREAMIPAIVKDFRVDTETHDIGDSFGGIRRQVAGRRHFFITMELHPRNNEELNWLVQSMQENGNRLVVLPDGSPIMHPSERDKPITSPVTVPRADKPQTPDSAW